MPQQKVTTYHITLIHTNVGLLSWGQFDKIRYQDICENKPFEIPISVSVRTKKTKKTW